jgi:RNA polymerase sigma factor (sigma-70 family)
MAGGGVSDVLGPLGRIFRDGAVSTLSDSQLLERFAARRDSTAFEGLLARHGPMVLAVCRRLLRDPYEAEDAFQATFLVLVRKAGSIRVDDSLGPWFHAVAWRVAERARADGVRRRAKEIPSEAVERALAAPHRETELADVIDRELNRLPEKYRVPIVLCHLDGLSHEEIAKRLGCPTGTISVRLMRARERLREQLRRRGSSLSVAAVAAALSSASLAKADVPLTLVEETTRVAIGAAARSTIVVALSNGVLKAMFREKVRTAALTLGTIGLLGLLAVLAVAGFKDDPKSNKTIVGRVVDQQGKPIPGAEVWLPIGFQRADENIPHAVADGTGQFAIVVERKLLDIDPYERSAALWAYSPGHSLGTALATRLLWGDDRSELTIRLGSVTDTAFSVLGPDSQPLVGARVEPYHVKTPVAYEFPPKPLLPRISGETDAQGRVRLPAIERKGFMTVEVSTPSLGRQEFRLQDRAEEPAERTIKMRPVGSVDGRIISDRPDLAGGIAVYLSTSHNDGALGSVPSNGNAQVVTDKDGRFRASALAIGELSIGLELDKTQPLRPRIPRQIQIRSGELTRVEIPIGPAVKIRGIVRSKEKKTPLGETTISLQYDQHHQNDQVTTRHDGKFEAYVLPGDVSTQVVVFPRGYVSSGGPPVASVRVPDGVDVFDLPAIELVKEQPPIVGRLISGRDRPVAEAFIYGVSGNRRFGYGRTDDKGNFELQGIPEGEKPAFEVAIDNDGEYGLKTEVVRADPLLLRVRLKRDLLEEAGTGASVSVRLIDRVGKPVAGVGLTLYEHMYDANGQLQSGQYVPLGVTDKNGSLKKSHLIGKGNDYRILVHPDGVAVAGGETIKSTGNKPVDFGAVAVDRLREIQGKILDVDGNPVVGATVLNWGNASPLTSATAGRDGTFRLGGVAQGEVHLFVEGRGFRYHHEALKPGAGPISVRLRRRDASPVRVLSKLGPAMPRAEAATLARRILGPYADQVLAGNDGDKQARVLEALAYIDPEDSWAKILDGEKTWNRDAAKLAVFRSFLSTSLEDATAVIPLIKSPFWRLHSVRELIDSLPSDEIDRKKAMILGGLSESRNLNDVSLRDGFLSQFARRLADLGEKEGALRVVKELQSPINKDGGADVQLGGSKRLAAVLGRVDPKAAVALIPDKGEERARNDLIGTIAVAVADSDPSAAEKLIGQFTHDSSEVFSVHTCRRMALVDLARARRMAAKIKSDCLRGYAYGLMADAIGTRERAATRSLLDDSFRAFADAAASDMGGVWSREGAAVMAASLLPVVERIDPDRLEEFFWRSLSLRWLPRSVNDLCRTTPDTSSVDAMRQTAALALYLARYDRDVARDVLDPVVKELLALQPGSEVGFLDWRLILKALAQVDPARAVELIPVIPDLNEREAGKIRDSARLTVAQALVESLDQVLAEARMSIIELEILLREEP